MKNLMKFYSISISIIIIFYLNSSYEQRSSEPDESFGTNGYATTTFTDGSSGINKIMVLSDGSILAGGWAKVKDQDNNFNTGFALAKFDQYGGLIKSIVINDSLSNIEDFEILSDGNIIAVGQAVVVERTIRKSKGAIARFSPSLDLDQSFAHKGKKVFFDFENIIDIAIKGNKIYAVIPGDKFQLLPINPDGTVGDLVTTDIGPDNDISKKVQIANNGKILVAGISNSLYVMTQYNDDLTIDQTFGTNGIVNTGISADYDGIALTIQPDGKILLAGGTSWFGLFISRFNPDGSSDLNFGTNGTTSSTQPDDFDQATAIGLLSNGSIIVVGNGWQNSEFINGLMKFKQDGTQYLQFGTNGRSLFELDYTFEHIAIQEDDLIVTGGVFWYDDHNELFGRGSKMAVARFHSIDFGIYSPLENELWMAGEQYTIMWDFSAYSVYILLSEDGGSTFTKIINHIEDNDGEYVWNIPVNILSRKCVIRIQDAINLNNFIDSDLFKIKGYILTRITSNDEYEAFSVGKHGWRFANKIKKMWPESWWMNRREFDYANGIDPNTGDSYLIH